MTPQSLRRKLFLTLALAIVVGCGKKDEPTETSIAAQGVALSKNGSPTAPTAGLRPFREAVVAEVPEGERRPPDVTATGKVVGKLYEEIAGREGMPGTFDQIQFVDAKGHKIRYFALVRTEVGDFRIALYADTAPNHVRNFIALARAGYYDGLPFHSSVRAKLDDRIEAFLESGCPLGTGEFGYGSIGYHLKPEISESLIHEDGTVGAWHGRRKTSETADTYEDVDNAACKFYITLARSPWRDASFTIFGKVVEGLDVAHKINERPNQTELGSEDRPVVPVLIRQVIIQAETGADS
jgi:cyclophilin family peptidyl-prolyl cis-trans isomerase